MGVENEHGVLMHTWERWSTDARVLFNDLFDLARVQEFILNAGDIRNDQAHWETIAWNVAFLAADMLTFRQNTATAAA